MRKTIAKVTGLVAACVCVFAMILVSFIVPRSAAADDGTFSTGFTVPSFCGKNNVIMLTSTGQVYQVFTPQPQLSATGNVGEFGGHVSGACMFPLPYLPMWDPRVTYTFDALASDNKTGDLWAVINTGTGNSIKMQAWRLTKADRIRYANYPNPYNSVMTYWKRVNQPMPIGNGMATGGAVDKANGDYYIAVVHPNNGSSSGSSVDFYASNGGDPQRKGTLYLSNDTRPSNNQNSDIEFDDQGNMTLVLSWISTGTVTAGTSRTGTRYVRRIHIPAANVQNRSFRPDSDTMVDTSKLAIKWHPDHGYWNGEVTGIGSNGSSSGLAVSLLNHDKGLSNKSLYIMPSGGGLNSIFTTPDYPLYKIQGPAENRTGVLVNQSLWGDGSSEALTGSVSAGDGFPGGVHKFLDGEITDLASIGVLMRAGI
jgi:hypothetical protein